MSFIQTNPIKNSTIMLIYADREQIKLDPPYQRMGDVWTKEKKQLLIDSILNDYDIPKIYFHAYNRNDTVNSNFQYSVIDGRQRLETIWGFIEGKFVLSDDFEYQKDISIKLAGLSYNDIAREYPRIKIQFDSFILPIVGITTDDEDLIEDMFSRLNEAAPLNAAEKRNAFGGEAVRAIREISYTNFFENKIKFPNKRYQHLEVSCRILFTENGLKTNNKIVDTKKVYLDKFTNDKRDAHNEMQELKNEVVIILEKMEDVFIQSDELLRSQGNIVLYYLLFRRALELNELHKITRSLFLRFREELSENRKKAEFLYSESSFELLEFDRLSQQGTNDASNLRERFRTLCKYFSLSNNEI